MLGHAPPEPDWARTREALDALGSQYLELLVAAGWRILALMAATVIVMLAWNRVARRLLEPDQPRTRWEQGLELALVLGAIATGLTLVAERASLVDDAFISFRYARNFAEGHGLVFNPGERVEGYTNFLWTFAIGLLVKLTPAEAPTIGLWASVACFVANLVVVWRIGRILARPYAPGLVFPLAVWLLAVQLSFTVFGTTGLETGCASLLVNLGALSLIEARADGSGFAPGWAGLFLILATLTRPDHALFYVVGAGVVFAAHVRGVWLARRDGARAMWTAGLRPMALYAAPFLIYAAYLAWKLGFYGQLLPNTYYTKSAALPYYEQGLIYMAIFHLASQLWLCLPLLAVWLALPAPDEATRRFKRFAVAGVAIYELYVMKVGGDFMHGRFYVTIVPLMLLGCGQLVLALANAPRSNPQSGPKPERGLRWPAFVVAPLLVASAGELPFVSDRDRLFHVVQEANFYPLTNTWPVSVDHNNHRAGQTLGGLRERGVELSVATGGIGLLGYYSRVPVIDLLGLTDAHVAHQPLERRARPGHEKYADAAYLHARAPDLVRGRYTPRAYRRLTRIKLGPNSGGRWYIWRYDREQMAEIRRLAPEIKFRDFERYLDAYIRNLNRKQPDEVARDLRWFDTYYFEPSDDPVRRDKIQRWLDTSAEPDRQPAAPDG